MGLEDEAQTALRPPGELSRSRDLHARSLASHHVHCDLHAPLTRAPIPRAIDTSSSPFSLQSHRPTTIVGSTSTVTSTLTRARIQVETPGPPSCAGNGPKGKGFAPWRPRGALLGVSRPHLPPRGSLPRVARGARACGLLFLSLCLPCVCSNFQYHRECRGPVRRGHYPGQLCVVVVELLRACGSGLCHRGEPRIPLSVSFGLGSSILERYKECPLLDKQAML